MADTENILQTVKTTIQDIVAPDVRELKVRMTSLEDQGKVHFEALKGQAEAQFKAILAAISQSRAETELSTYKQIAALSERVAALEARHQ